MKDILLVEDNEELAELLTAFLTKADYSVCHVIDGETAVETIEQELTKLIILDITLPGIDGFAVCSAIREKREIPILIVSARVDKEDKLHGFELGADDYVEKPIDPDILVAKVGAMMARNSDQKEEKLMLVSGELTMDVASRKVYRKEQELNLNVKEYELLKMFIENPGKTLHKEYLFNQIWGADSFSENQTLTVHIKMLRKKIEQDPKNPQRIRTVWGVGYRYEEI